MMQGTDFGVLSFIYLLNDSVCGLFIRNLPFCVLRFWCYHYQYQSVIQRKALFIIEHCQ